MTYRTIGLQSMMILLTLSSISYSHATTRDVWIFGLQTPQVIRSKVQPFFDALGEKLGVQYRVISSTDLALVLKGCKDGVPAIVGASKPLADAVADICAYKKVLVSRQTAILYTDADRNLDWNSRLRIGFVKNLDVTAVAQEELLASGVDFQAFVYPDMFNLIRSYKQDGLDACVMSDETIQVVDSFARNKKPVYVFRQLGEAFILVAPNLSDREVDLLVSESSKSFGLSKQVWREGVGISGFMPYMPGKSTEGQVFRK